MGYNLIKSIVVLLALLVAGGVFGWRSYRLLWVNLRRGQPSAVLGQWGERIKGLIIYVGAQLRLFRFLVPGTAHFFMFWGFTILSLTILQAMLEGVLAFAVPGFTLPFLGSLGPLALLQDLFPVFVVVAVIYALYLRLVVNPERYKGSHKSQGVMVLLFVFTIMVSLMVGSGIRIEFGRGPRSILGGPWPHSSASSSLGWRMGHRRLSWSSATGFTWGSCWSS